MENNHKLKAETRLLALDLDGTLLTDEKQLTPRGAESVHRAVESGITVALVTGRPLSGIPEPVMALPGIRYVITSNGAITTDLQSGKKLRTACIDRAAAREIARIPMERDLVHSAFIDGAGYCEPHYFELQWQFFAGKPQESYIRASRRRTDDLISLMDGSEAGVENIWFITRSRSERNELAEMINSRWDVKTVLTTPTDVEVGDPGADKGLALRELSESLGIDRNGIVAIGDNDNDLGMLKAAGTAVAMGNALKRVKEIADIITDSNDEDGAAKVIEWLAEEKLRR
ncbi:MAG: HAD family phosphatase [Oscillospiraceae bacterium]|nr:HAD family phosphatase [Oscillospiraceae bacterium]